MMVKMTDLSIEKNDFLELLKIVYLIAGKLNIKAYIWGGFVQEIIENKYSRNHRDLDMFIENLDTKINDITEVLERENIKYEYKEQFKMLVLYRNSVHIGINPVLFEHTIAIWKHIGDKGFVIFLKEWLDNKFRDYNGINVLTAGIKFEYCFRKIAKYVNPDWKNKNREKDIKNLEYYKNKLIQKSIDPKELLQYIYSYNPFWFKHGYKELKEPIIVVGKDYI
jgi:hypothetical protein